MFGLTHNARTRYVRIPECAPAIPYLRRDLYAILVDLFDDIESGECVCDSKKEAHVCEAIAWAQSAQPLSVRNELRIRVVMRTVCRIQMWLLQDLRRAQLRGTYPDQMTSGLCSDWRRVSAPYCSRQISQCLPISSKRRHLPDIRQEYGTCRNSPATVHIVRTRRMWKSCFDRVLISYCTRRFPLPIPTSRRHRVPPHNLLHDRIDISKALSVRVSRKTRTAGESVEFGLSSTLDVWMKHHSEKEGLHCDNSLLGKVQCSLRNNGYAAHGVRATWELRARSS